LAPPDKGAARRGQASSHHDAGDPNPRTNLLQDDIARDLEKVVSDKNRLLPKPTAVLDRPISSLIWRAATPTLKRSSRAKKIVADNEKRNETKRDLADRGFLDFESISFHNHTFDVSVVFPPTHSLKGLGWRLLNWR
jgi:hypothetical protein